MPKAPRRDAPKFWSRANGRADSVFWAKDPARTMCPQCVLRVQKAGFCEEYVLIIATSNCPNQGRSTMKSRDPVLLDAATSECSPVPEPQITRAQEQCWTQECLLNLHDDPCALISSGQGSRAWLDTPYSLIQIWNQGGMGCYPIQKSPHNQEQRPWKLGFYVPTWSIITSL